MIFFYIIIFLCIRVLEVTIAEFDTSVPNLFMIQRVLCEFFNCVCWKTNISVFTGMMGVH